MLLKLCGDAKTIVDWANGQAVAKKAETKTQVAFTQKTLAQLWNSYNMMPATACADWVTHQYRKFNDTADKLATKAVLERKSLWVQKPIPKKATAIQGAFDGGKRGNSSGAGWWFAAGTPVKNNHGP